MSKGTGPPPEPLYRNTACAHLDFSPVRPGQTSDLQNCQIRSWCCLSTPICGHVLRPSRALAQHVSLPVRALIQAHFTKKCAGKPREVSLLSLLLLFVFSFVSLAKDEVSACLSGVTASIFFPVRHSSRVSGPLSRGCGQGSV